MYIHFMNEFDEEIESYAGLQEFKANRRYCELRACNPETGETVSKHINFSNFKEIRITKE